jgi:hypothetical protein
MRDDPGDVGVIFLSGLETLNVALLISKDISTAILHDTSIVAIRRYTATFRRVPVTTHRPSTGPPTQELATHHRGDATHATRRASRANTTYVTCCFGFFGGKATRGVCDKSHWAAPPMPRVFPGSFCGQVYVFGQRGT